MTDSRVRTLGYVTAFSVMLLDQITKRMALGSLDLHTPVSVIGQFLRFTLAWNQGAAFSMPWGGPIFLTIVTAAAAVLVTVFIWKLADRPPLFVAGLGAILGGALGNLLDRFIHGMVVDFIDVGFSGWRWPTFNVADIAITCGGILIILLYRNSMTSKPESEDS